MCVIDLRNKLQWGRKKKRERFMLVHVEITQKGYRFRQKIFLTVTQLMFNLFFPSPAPDLFLFFYFKSFLDFVTMSAVTHIIHILHNCLRTEYNFTVLRVRSKLLSGKTTKDMHEAKRKRDESEKMR